VESTIWHTTLEMRHRKFMGYYRMSFEAFNNLLLELTLFFQSHCVNLIQPQVEIRKFVTIVIYRLAHGNSATHHDQLVQCGNINHKKICRHSM
jgi:hypothetical protein